MRVSFVGNAFIGSAMRPHRSRMALAYALLVLESIALAAQPWAWGVAIDAVVGGQQWGVGMIFAQHMIYTLVGTTRHRYDTRVFTRMSADVSMAVVNQQRAAGVRTSVVPTRVGLASSLIGFLENSVPEIVRGGILLISGLVALYLYSPTLAVPAVVLAVPVTVLNAAYSQRCAEMLKRINGHREKSVDRITEGTALVLSRHFRALSFWNIRWSDAGANNFLGSEIFVMCAVAAVVWMAGTGEGVTAGMLYAVMGYFWRVVGGLDVVPRTVASVASVRDVLARLAEPAR